MTILPSFDEVYRLTSTRISEVAFEREEAMAYYSTLASLPTGATVVEIGLQYGRSSSVVLQLQRAKEFKYVAIDPYCEAESVEAAAEWMRMWASMDPRPKVDLRLERSDRAWFPPADLILVDGDHSEGGVRIDCGIVEANLNRGGYACFHDYGRSSLPQVRRVVDELIGGNPEFQHVSTATTLAIYRRQC